MKIVTFILGIAALLIGLGLTAWTWYRAYAEGRIIEGTAYAGPVLTVLGALRMFRAAATIPMPVLGRYAVIGVAILCGYGNSAAIKAVFPGDQVIASTNH